MYKLGVDVGATKINIGILNGNNEVAAKRKVMVSRLSEKGITDGIIRSIDGLLAETGVSKEEIASCGVGVPGTVSEDGRRAVKVPNLSLENAELSAALEAATGIPVRLIQDSRAAAYGEYLAGGGQGKKTVVCVTLGSGIGTGIVIDGQVYNGALGGAGEMGHLPAVEGGRPCGCGKSGCMEKYAAGIGLDITAREALGKEDATAADLFRAAEDGDEKAESAIGEAVAMLGRAMVAVVNL
ncbi:MAG: ROK family protein, partial [Defluviitaleaceae bacterium]|nr:ROK family protein [Defluviitaleaceae bacterium]